MRLTVLGASGAFPGMGAACSGFVVEGGSTRLVVDLGWGTLPLLFELLGSHTGDGLDGVVVTHEHPDHMADLYGLFRARWYLRRDHARLPLLAPQGVHDRLAGEHDGDIDDVARVFVAYRPTDAPLVVGELDVEVVLLPHYVPNLGVRVRHGEKAVAITGDTGPTSALCELGRDVDLFVVDATDRHQQPGVAPAPPGTPPLNLTATQAGEAARAAGARRLLLTHLWPGNDPTRAREEAAACFAGEVQVARGGLVIDV